MKNIVCDTAHYFSGGVYAKKMVLAAGQVATTHQHEYDHMSILSSGIAVVSCDGIEKKYASGDVVEIKKGVEHSILAIEDSVWFCIHKIPDDLLDISKIDEVLIK